MTDSAPSPPIPRHAAAQRPDSPPPHLILASASPRRAALLRNARYAFTTILSNVDESDHPPGLTAEQLARHLAECKARVVADAFPRAVILGADTVVESATGEILGKPADRADARRILTLLSGTEHQVITAVAVIRLSPAFAEITAVRSTVRMRRLTPTELDAYLATGNWQGKAGAYGIQDNDPFVTAIAGCPTNIVGLPMTTTAALLSRVGILPTSPRP